jgi:hypothetical protein
MKKGNKSLSLIPWQDWRIAPLWLIIYNNMEVCKDFSNDFLTFASK